MNCKLSADERSNFSGRLKLALISADQPISASALARAFNLRAHGAKVTSHGARKWLNGDAIPTQEKVIILAKWLDVHASWLRFGHAEIGTTYEFTPRGAEELSRKDMALIRDVVSLPAPSQLIVRDMVDCLMRAASRVHEPTVGHIASLRAAG